MNQRARCVAWGEIIWDHFPDRRALGGAPSNVAHHLAQLEQRVSLVSRVGADALGDEALEVLASRGVDTSCVTRDSQHPTGEVEIALTSKGEPIYTMHRDRAWEFISLDDRSRSALDRADAFLYGTLSQRRKDACQSLASALKSLPASCLRVCDPNVRPTSVPAQTLRLALAEADIVKTTDEELETIRDVLGESDPLHWLLAQPRKKLVAVTHGAKGCTLHDNQRKVTASATEVDTSEGNAVGCGDAFTAALAVARLHGSPLAQAAKAANVYAAFTATRPSATPLVPKDVIARFWAKIATPAAHSTPRES